MLYNLAIRHIKQNYLLHGLHVVIVALAIWLYFDFLLMASDQRLMAYYQPVFPADQLLIFFSVLVALLLVIFSVYWDQLLLKQRYRAIGLLQLMGQRKFKILGALLLEVLISQLIAFSLGILLGLLFYKLFALILLKISGIKVMIGFFFAVRPLLWTLGLIPILQALLALNHILTIRHLNLLRLLKSQPKSNHTPMPGRQLYVFGGLTLILFSGVLWAIKNVFFLTYQVAWLLDIPETLSFIGVFLCIVCLWAVALCGLFRFVLPMVFKLLQHIQKLYLQGIQPVTFAELRHWFTHNYRSLAMMSLVMGLAFSILGLSTLLLRYSQASVESYAPYSVLTTAKLRPAVVAELNRSQVRYRQLPPIQGTVLPLSYRLETVVGEDYTSVASPGMALTTTTYNRFAKAKGYPTIHLQPNNAALILPITSIVKEHRYRQPGQRPKVKVGAYEAMTLKIATLSNHFPLGDAMAFDLAIVVNPGDYAKLTEGIQETYYAFELPNDLHKKQLQRLKALNRRQYYHISDSYLMKYGQGPKHRGNVFMHHQLYLRQLQEKAAQRISGLFMFVGVFVSLVLIVAIAAIVMLKRLTVAQDTQANYQTLLKIGVSPPVFRRTIHRTQALIYGLLLILGFGQSLLVADVFGILINRPDFYLLYWIAGVYTLLYALIGRLTARLYGRIVHL